MVSTIDASKKLAKIGEFFHDYETGLCFAQKPL